MGHYDSCYESDAEEKCKEDKKHTNSFQTKLKKLLEDEFGDLDYFEHKDKIEEKLEEALFWSKK